VLGDLDQNIREERIAKIKEFQVMSGYFEKLEKIKSEIDLSVFVNSQYDAILKQAGDNKLSFPSYKRDLKIDEVITAIVSGEKDMNSKIEMWASKSYSKVHKIIAVILQNENCPKIILSSKIEELGITQNASGSLNSLMTNAGNSYGKILQEDNGIVVFCPEIKNKIVSYQWSL